MFKEEPEMTTFPAKNHNLVIIKDLELRGMCSHHLAPFFGKCSVAYIPNNKILGLSKFQRALDYIAKVPNEQENVTNKFIEYLWNKLHPKGIMVVMEATHTCMVTRGVQNSCSKTLTMEKRGKIDLSHLINLNK